MSDLLKKIYDCGNIQFSIAETALYCELDENELVDNKEYSNAYLKGRVEGEALARNEVLKSARNGDISACRQLLQLAEKSRPEIEDDDGEAEETTEG